MPYPSLSRAAELLLDRLERREAGVLAWGVSDTRLTDRDVEQEAEAVAAEIPESDPDDLIEELVGANHLFAANPDTGVMRTRMAETVRLLHRMRQLFPSHKRIPRGWTEGRSLVGDFRFDVRPRRYPARHLSGAAVWQRVASMGLSPAQRSAFEALVGGRMLSDFQAQAAERVLGDLTSTGARGLLIGAGTGTGKTLAFYLPALVHLVGLAEDNGPAAWTKAVAVYPRNELLKDQFTTALGYVETVNAASGRAPLTLGALYGQTPTRATPADLKRSGWTRDATFPGFRCPYLRLTPQTGEPPGPEHDLFWSDVMLKSGREVLVTRSGRLVGEGVVRITRKGMEASPPDLLFTTTEMLNRHLSSAPLHRVFGVGVARKPELLLLDEVHTYAGTTGAQVAYLLRRWRHAVRPDRLHVTGLSATLRDPTTFFADLTGLLARDIIALDAEAAAEGRIDTRGHEYRIVLQHDPFELTQALSATIQAAMVLRRHLDPPGPKGVGGAAGQRLFAFTDDLDTINRLYDDLASAEGLRPTWKGYEPDTRDGKGPLAWLRADDVGWKDDDEAARFADGQRWRLAEEIGHRLGVASRVERVSSQDQGVNPDADIVVASASLEVGFDDDRVGAVLQHKAPHNTAAYLQRKGRAGRRADMRPWTCVVLGAYGRDQTLFQRYERLFDPEVEMQRLPLGNRYILRIQATYAFVEWLSTQVPSSLRRSFQAWMLLSRVPEPGQYEGYARDRLKAVLKVLDELLGDPHGSRAESLRTHLREVLGPRWADEATRVAFDDTLHLLLWERPRALITGVAPTLRRRLATDHYHFAHGQKEDEGTPLPDYMPPNLFTDLNLPEVCLVAEHVATKGDAPGESFSSESVERTLRQYAPGRVSRRLGFEHSKSRHWVYIPADALDAGERPLDLRDFVEASDPIGLLPGDPGGADVHVFRPWRLRLGQAPEEVMTGSNSQPRWRTYLRATEGALALDVPKTDPFSALVRRIRVCTHAEAAPVTLVRYTTGADAVIRVKEKGSHTSTAYEANLHYVHGDARAALGYTLDADGLAIDLASVSGSELRAQVASRPDRLAATRTAYFRHRVIDGGVLDVFKANIFQRAQLADLLHLTLLLEAQRTGQSLADAHEALQTPDEGGMAPYEKTLVSALGPYSGALPLNDEDDEHALRARAQELDSLLHGPLLDVLVAEAPRLWEPLGADADAWLRSRYDATLAGALTTACAGLTPGQQADGFLADLVTAGDETTVWLTEASMGGVGLVEHVARAITDDPRRFFGLVSHALEADAVEQVADALPYAVRAALDVPAVADAVAFARTARGIDDQGAALVALGAAWDAEGILATHALRAAYAARALRPGADAGTDALLGALVDGWAALEERHGGEVPVRLAALVLARDGEIAALVPLPRGVSDGEARRWVERAVLGLLWARGDSVRREALRHYHPFTVLPPADRVLALDRLSADVPVVDVEIDGWESLADDALRTRGLVHLRARLGSANRLGRALDRSVQTPVEAGYLHGYAYVSAVYRDGAHLRAVMELDELAFGASPSIA